MFWWPLLFVLLAVGTIILWIVPKLGRPNSHLGILPNPTWSQTLLGYIFIYLCIMCIMFDSLNSNCLDMCLWYMLTYSNISLPASVNSKFQMTAFIRKKSLVILPSFPLCSIPKFAWLLTSNSYCYFQPYPHPLA